MKKISVKHVDKATMKIKASGEIDSTKSVREMESIINETMTDIANECDDGVIFNIVNTDDGCVCLLKLKHRHGKDPEIKNPNQKIDKIKQKFIDNGYQDTDKESPDED